MASSPERRHLAVEEVPVLAHSPSAIKRHRQSLRRRERNRARRSAARTAVRRARELIAAGKRDEAEGAVREAVAILDRAAQKGVLHPNNASRRKSRLMRRFGAPAEEEAPKRRRPRTTTKTAAKKTSGRSSRAKKS